MIEQTDPSQLPGLLELMKSMGKLLERQLAAKKAYRFDRVLGTNEAEQAARWFNNHICGLFEMLASGVLPEKQLWKFVRRHDQMLQATRDFPAPFAGAPLVVGLFYLGFRLLSKIRGGGEGDIGMLSYRLKEGMRLSPTNQNAIKELLNKYPFLQPAIVAKGMPLDKVSNLSQRFGDHWGLDPNEIAPRLNAPKVKPQARQALYMLERAFHVHPLRSFFALVPFYCDTVDKSGEKLYFDKHTWPEQLEDLARLQRKAPKSVLIRPATLPEMIFLDLAGRLSAGETGVEIWSFRCSHPDGPEKYLAYGGASQTGSKITLDVRTYPSMIMPVFELLPDPPEEVKPKEQ